MRSAFSVLTALAIAFSSSAYASPMPCKYAMAQTEGAQETRVDAGGLYRASDLVVTGKVVGRNGDSNDLLFDVTKTIKGMAHPQVVLRGQQAGGTETNGFMLPGNREVLLFLKSTGGGIFDATEEYNSACNITRFVQDGQAVLVEKDEHNEGLAVKVDELGTYLDSNPPPLVYKY